MVSAGVVVASVEVDSVSVVEAAVSVVVATIESVGFVAVVVASVVVAAPSVEVAVSAVVVAIFCFRFLKCPILAVIICFTKDWRSFMEAALMISCMTSLDTVEVADRARSASGFCEL